MAQEDRTPTQISKISLRNWRNFRDASVSLRRRAFVIGPNASGKSNFLDSFRFLHQLVSVGGGFQAAVDRRNGVSTLRCLSARRYPDIEIEVELADSRSGWTWKYELAFSQDNRQRPLVKRELVTSGGRVILNRPDEHDKQDEERLSQTYLEQVNANREFREIADFFSSIKYSHLVPQLVREPDRSVGKKSDPYGGDFLEQIGQTNERTRKSRLGRITDALRVAVPQLLELDWMRDERGTPHLRGRYEHWRSQGAWQTEADFSDGTLRLLGLLWAMPEGAGPLLLEEPELSLHPDVVRMIPQMFDRVQRRYGRQVIVSTHSQDLLADEGIGLDEVILLQPSPEGTILKSAASLNDVELLMRGGISLGEAVLPKTRPQNVHQLSIFDI